MLLECNSIETLIVNLEQIPVDVDSSLTQLLDIAPCVFIIGPTIRRQDIKEELPLEDVSFYRPVFHLPIDMYLKEILADIGKNPYQCVYITGDPDEIHLASSIGLATVLYNDDDETQVNRLSMPDYEADSIEDLVKCLDGSRYGYFGELHAHGISGNGNFMGFELKHLLDPEIEANVLVSGRYFTTSDRRAFIHPLTNKILQMKNGNHVDSMAQLLAYSFEVFSRREKADAITLVPPRPNSQNKLLPVLQATTKAEVDPIKQKLIHPDLLRAVVDYDAQKYAGNFHHRFLNVSGAFRTNGPVSGHIVIFDDIVTSGATALECARMLYEEGADKVSIIAFGSSQMPVPSNQTEKLKCDRPGCSENYQMRFNSRDQTAFFGCRNFSKCGNRGLQFEKGRKQYNRQNDLEANVPADDGDLL